MTHLQEGAPAPAFTGADQNNTTHSLANFAGKKVILYFYPKDDTPGCTAQACNLRDNHEALIQKGMVVLGVSPDSVKSHGKFAGKFNLPFPLLADEDQAIANAYGVFGEKTFMGKKYMGIHRTTFVINENGIIDKIFSKVDTKNHTQQILDALAH